MIPRLVDTPVLETPRLILRAPGPADWEGFATFLASPRSCFVGGPVERTKAWRAFGHLTGHWVLRGFGSFIITLKETGAAIGMTGPWFPEGWPERELGWAMWSDDHQGWGLAFEAATAARDFAFRDLGWTTAVSYINPGNTRSIALAERLGARRDTEAAIPHPEEPTLVYRHPKPKGAA